ncbi:MAG: hypothetical protein H0U45_09705 [Tatlockia sp.]|nr:hypothetical protein [Tatlockia sp.]
MPRQPIQFDVAKAGVVRRIISAIALTKIVIGFLLDYKSSGRGCDRTHKPPKE